VRTLALDITGLKCSFHGTPDSGDLQEIQTRPGGREKGAKGTVLLPLLSTATLTTAPATGCG
jgi:hypothetical protein